MEKQFQKQIKELGQLFTVFGVLIMALFGMLFLIKLNPSLIEDKETQETVALPLDDAVIASSGFANDEHVSLVIQNCTNCHSAKLVTQNQMSAAGWDATITWMQETQNLWDLGQNREKIVAYLAKNYSPKDKGRRQNLTDIEWYELEK